MKLWTELREASRISFAAISANKLRSVLTTLGIVIGILTVTLMAMAIQGLSQSFLRSVSILGADVFYIEKFPWEEDQPWWKYRGRRNLEISDYRAVQRESTHALGVTCEVSGNWPVKSEYGSASMAWIVGTTEQAALVRNLNPAEGRFLTREEAEGGRPVCVLGSEMAQKLFPGQSAIGRKIKIAQTNFEVVGVNEKLGQFLFGNLDNQILIPLPRFMAEFLRYPYVMIMVKVHDVNRLEDAREELRGIMRKSRRLQPGVDDDFAINQQQVIIDTFKKVGGVIASAGLFITGLSLFVGGIGIMNIMFVSVAERTREIGIRKAIGAKRRTIMIQFLTEAAVICIFGGLVGLAIAFPISLAVKSFLPTSITLPIAALALTMATLTGVVAGFMPAWRAARMNPVDALRAE